MRFDGEVGLNVGRDEDVARAPIAFTFLDDQRATALNTAIPERAAGAPIRFVLALYTGQRRMDLEYTCQ